MMVSGGEKTTMMNVVFYTTLYLFLTLQTNEIHAFCPEGCACANKVVNCTRIVKMEDIPNDTEYLNLSRNGLGRRMILNLLRLSSLKSLRNLDISHNDLNCSCLLLEEMKALASNVTVKGASCLFDNKKWGMLNMKCNHLPDNCNEEKDKCHYHASCQQIKNTSVCTCKDGFIGNGLTCRDVNECRRGKPCHRNAHCHNMIGSFKCTCNTGYAGNGTHCKDIDECKGRDDCFHNQTCENLLGSFRCNCNPGFYKREGYPDYCEDVDECKEKTSMCSKLVTCTNTIGSYACGACPANYIGDGIICYPTCQISRCPGHAKCFDLKTGGECRCPLGMYNRSHQCTIGITLIQIRRLKVYDDVTSRDLQSNSNSIAFIELAMELEPILLRYLKATFPSVVDVQLNETRKILDILLVDFIVILDRAFNDTATLADDIEKKVQNGINNRQLLKIQGDTEIMLSAKDTDICQLSGSACGHNAKCVIQSNVKHQCMCDQGYTMHYKECVKDRTALALKITVPLIIIITFAIFIGVITYVIHKKPLKSEKGLLTFTNDEFYSTNEEDGNWKKTTYL